MGNFMASVFLLDAAIRIVPHNSSVLHCTIELRRDAIRGLPLFYVVDPAARTHTLMNAFTFSEICSCLPGTLNTSHSLPRM